MTNRSVALSLILSLVCLPVLAQTSASDTDLLARIRKEEGELSQIMKTIHMLADVYGPRLTGTPNHKNAAEWAIKQMKSWGLENAHLEPWDFGHPGWLNERLTAHVISPVKDPLVCEVLSWTPGTKGTVQAKAYQLFLPERPTQDQLTAFFAKEKTKVRGRIVLAGRHTVVPISLSPPAKRLTDEQAQQRFGPNPRPFPQPSPTPTPAANAPRPLTNRQVDEQIDTFLKDNGALIRVNDAGREFRQIRAFNNRTFDVDKALPTVVMSNEDYGRITRILADGTDVVLEFNIVNSFYPEGATSYNTIAEIPGSGEEEGLLGSIAYVKQHFGSFENPKPGYEKFGGYFNIDSGTGRVRGASVFGPPEAANIIRDILAPFKDDGIVGANPSRSRALGGSDNTSFSQAGLPGIGMGQDPIEYGTNTWHTNLDTYERILEDDVKKDATEVAWAVYQLAMRDDLLPRYTKDTMPPKPAEPPTMPSPPLSKPASKSTTPAAKATTQKSVAGSMKKEKKKAA